MKLITDKVQFDNAIVRIQKAGKKLDNDIHVVALSAVAHLNEQGDIHRVNQVFLALAKGARKSAMVAWLTTYGKCKPNEAADKKEKPFVYAKVEVPEFELAIANPWYEYKPEPSPDEMFCFRKQLEYLIKRAENKSELDDPTLFATIKELLT